MDNKFDFFSQIENGKTNDICRVAIKKTLQLFNGKEVHIIIKAKKSKRSIKQNAHWFLLLQKYALPVFRDAGANWDVWHVHEHLMQELGYTQIFVLPSGEPKELRIHSSKMDAKTFFEITERMIAHLATEYDVHIPVKEFDHENQ